jgi:hypothetical protein
MTTPRTAPISLSEQEKASLEAAKQLPWTPSLLPLNIRRSTVIREATTPVLPSPAAAAGCVEDPVTPRNQGIVLYIPGAPLCPPLLERNLSRTLEQ